MRCKYLTSVVCIQGDHNGDEVDPRLLFRIDYCLPDCGRKCSQEKQDERQQFNKGEREETEKNDGALKSEPRIDDEQENPEGPLLLTTSF